MIDEYQNADFGIKLTGDMHGVDADTLVVVLGNLSLAIHQINNDIQSNKSLKISIKNIQPGSYSIFLNIKKSFLNVILQHITTSPTTAAAEIVGIFASLLVIRHFLKGEKPKKIKKSGNQTVIINESGNEIKVEHKIYKIYQDNQIIDNAIGKSFDSLKEDSAIDSFEIYDENQNKLCNIPKEDFNVMALPSVSSERDTRIKIEETFLTVFKVVFEQGYKWQFYYHGIKISAFIKDEDFFSRIDNGVRFAKGDVLKVDLSITQIYDKTIQTYVNKEYSITKIKQHILRKEQEKLFSE